jgi:MFS family permease
LAFTVRRRLSPIWRQRDFRLLWTGETISVLGSGISQFALPLVAVLTLHVSSGQLGLMRALGAAPGIVLGLLAGVWVDRVSRRRLLIGAELLAAVLVASIPVANAVGSITLVHLYALWVAFGFIGTVWWPAWNSFVPSVVPPADLVEANSKLMFSWSASLIAGPAIGGLLVAWLTAPNAMIVDAASFLICVAFLAAIPEPPRPPAEGVAPAVMARIVEGLRTTFLDPMQRAITLPRLVLDFIDALASAVLVIFVIREVRLSPAYLGVGLALSAVGFVVGSVVAPRIERRAGLGRTILVGLGLVAVSPYTMVVMDRRWPIAVNVAFIAIPGLVGGLGGIMQFIGLSTLRQSITPEQVRGRVFASASVAGRVLTVCGALAGGMLGETIGLRPTIAIAAVAYAIPFVYAITSPLRTVGTSRSP